MRWTNDTIIFTTYAQCVDYTYTISRASERLVGTRTPKKAEVGTCLGGVGKDTCAAFPEERLQGSNGA